MQTTNIGAIALLAAAALAAGSSASQQQVEKAASRARFWLSYRRTLEGDLCAASFVAPDGETYAGCTRARDPEGNVGAEWCYTDAADRGWSKCAAASNMQTLRDSVEGAMRVKAGELADEANAMERLRKSMISQALRAKGCTSA